MKNRFFTLLLTHLLLFSAILNLSAQDIQGGTVKYEQTKKYDFESTFSMRRSDRMKDFVSSLPKEGKVAKVLLFNSKNALFGDDPQIQEALPENLQRAQRMASYFSPPTPEVKQVFYDFEGNKKMEQILFMTRTFRINSEITPPAWKMNNRMKKVFDYTCMGAETMIGEQTILVWFTPEIPISAGPDQFYGLPGLILAVEIDGALTFIVKEINIETEKEINIEKPEEGKKIKQEAFDLLVVEKVEEFHKEREARMKARGHGKGRRGH